MTLGIFTSCNPRRHAKETSCSPSESWKSEARTSSCEARAITAVSSSFVKNVGKTSLPMVKVRQLISMNRKTIFMLLIPISLTATKSFSPRFFPIIIVEATPKPAQRLKVKEAMLMVTWWAAMSVVLTIPQIKAAKAKAVTSKNNCIAVGRPNFSRVWNISFLKRETLKLSSLMYLLVMEFLFITMYRKITEKILAISVA